MKIVSSTMIPCTITALLKYSKEFRGETDMHPRKWTDRKLTANPVVRMGVPLLIGGLAVIAFANQFRVADRLHADQMNLQAACIAGGGTVISSGKKAGVHCVDSMGLTKPMSITADGQVIVLDPVETDGILEANAKTRSHG